MPHSSYQLGPRATADSACQVAIRSDDTLVVKSKKRATEVSPLPNLAGLAPAQPLGDAGLIGTIPFQHADLHAKDILGQFALAEGKKDGHWSGATKTSPQRSPKGWRGGANQYFTPKSIASLIVEMIVPYYGCFFSIPMKSSDFIVQFQCFSGISVEGWPTSPRVAKQVSDHCLLSQKHYICSHHEKHSH